MSTAKLFRDGKVAINISRDYGAGWSTWADTPEEREQKLFDTVLAYLLDSIGDNERTEEDLANINLHLKRFYPRDYEADDEYAERSAIRQSMQLHVVWLPEGTAFRVKEYDGFESVELRDNINWTIA
mgnify:CR=1 FL=1